MKLRRLLAILALLPAVPAAAQAPVPAAHDLTGMWEAERFFFKVDNPPLLPAAKAMVDGYAAGINAIPGMRVFGAPDLSILAFGAGGRDMAAVAAGMERRGWVPGLVRRPPGLHLMLSLLHESARETYLADLAAATGEAPARRNAEVAASY